MKIKYVLVSLSYSTKRGFWTYLIFDSLSMRFWIDLFIRVSPSLPLAPFALILPMMQNCLVLYLKILNVIIEFRQRNCREKFEFNAEIFIPNPTASNIIFPIWLMNSTNRTYYVRNVKLNAFHIKNECKAEERIGIYYSFAYPDFNIFQTNIRFIIFDSYSNKSASWENTYTTRYYFHRSANSQPVSGVMLEYKRGKI